MSKKLPQIVSVLQGAIPSDSAVVWTWLHFQGGDKSIGEILGVFPNRCYALADLESRKLIKYHDDFTVEALWRPPAPGTATPAVKGTPPPARARPQQRRGVAVAPGPGRAEVRDALEHPRRKGSKEIIDKAIERVFRLYQKARRKHGAHPVRSSEMTKNRSRFKRLLKYEVLEGIDLEEFFDFAYHRTKWQNYAFPPPGNVAGEWVRNEWDERDAKASAGHAGARSRSTNEVDEFFSDVYGDHTYTAEEKQHIESQARLLARRPHLYEQDPKFDAEVQDLAEWMVEQGIL